MAHLLAGRQLKHQSPPKFGGWRLLGFFSGYRSLGSHLSFTCTLRTRTDAQPRQPAAHPRSARDLSSHSVASTPRPGDGSFPRVSPPAWSGPVPAGSFSPPSVSAVTVERRLTSRKDQASAGAQGEFHFPPSLPLGQGLEVTP